MYVEKAQTSDNEILWLVCFDDKEERDSVLENLRELSKRLYAQEDDELPEDKDDLESYYQSLHHGKEFMELMDSLEKRCIKGKGDDLISFINLEEIGDFMEKMMILSFGGNIALDVKDGIISTQEDMLDAYRQHYEILKLKTAPPTGMYS